MVLKELITGFWQMEENAQERETEKGWSGRGALSEAGRAALPERKKKGQTETVEGRKDLCLRTLDTNPVCAKKRARKWKI